MKHRSRMWKVRHGIAECFYSEYREGAEEYCPITELQEAQERVKVLREALMRLDAGYAGMFGNQSISAKDESWIMAPIIVREALAKLEGK